MKPLSQVYKSANREAAKGIAVVRAEALSRRFSLSAFRKLLRNIRRTVLYLDDAFLVFHNRIGLEYGF